MLELLKFIRWLSVLMAKYRLVSAGKDYLFSMSFVVKNGEDAQNDKEEPKNEVVKLPDYLVNHLLHECHIIEWVLRLSCIPQDR